MTMPDALARLHADAPPFAWGALALALMVPPTVLLLAMDGRQVDGAPVWLKPLKFEISLVLYLATLAWAARALPEALREGAGFRLYAWAVVAMVAAEMVWLTAAAGAGVRSHFNPAPGWSAVYGLMGLVAVGLTSATLVMGVAIARAGPGAMAPALHLGLWLGLVLTFALTVPVAGALASGAAPGRAGAVWPGLGWSRAGPDLRPAHFLATHAMQALPVFGLLVPWRGAVVAFAAVWAGLVVWQVARARAGLPPF